jgi:hypothetical protein
MPIQAPDHLALLFTPGASHPHDDGSSLSVRVLPGVPLSLPSGRVVAIDPFYYASGDPAQLAFTEQVPPGTYQVALAAVDVIGRNGRAQDTRMAAARLQIRDEPVVDWELALQPGQDAQDLAGHGAGRPYGFGVDTGTGCFLDAQTFRAIGDEQEWAERVVGAMWGLDPQAPPDAMREPVDDPIVMPVGEDSHAVIVFSTGWGDGTYATWIGRTAAGDVACFLTDFGLF